MAISLLPVLALLAALAAGPTSSAEAAGPTGVTTAARQEAPVAPRAEQTAPDSSRAAGSIPVPEIAKRADEVTGFLRDLQALAVPGPAIEAIRTRLPEQSARHGRALVFHHRAAQAGPNARGPEPDVGILEVQMSEVAGEVRRVGIRATTVQTWDGAEVIVPNATLVNWTLPWASPMTPPRTGSSSSCVAHTHPQVLRAPAPAALCLGFGDSALQFEIRVWTDRFDLWVQTRSDLIVAIHAALREAGIEIPFPQRDVHLRQR